MEKDLKIDKEYKIEYKGWFLKKYFNFIPIIVDLRNSPQNDPDDYLIKKLKIFGVPVDRAESCYSFTFRKSGFIGPSHFNIYNCFFPDSRIIKVMEIMDIHVLRKNKGIGTKILTIINKIAIENGVSLIVGELEKDSKDGSLEKRKNFFMKNGYIAKNDKRAKFSGWMVKKFLDNF